MIFMAVAMVLTRTAGLAARAAALPRTQTSGAPTVSPLASPATNTSAAAR